MRNGLGIWLDICEWKFMNIIIMGFWGKNEWKQIGRGRGDWTKKGSIDSTIQSGS